MVGVAQEDTWPSALYSGNQEINIFFKFFPGFVKYSPDMSIWLSYVTTRPYRVLLYATSFGKSLVLEFSSGNESEYACPPACRMSTAQFYWCLCAMWDSLRVLLQHSLCLYMWSHCPSLVKYYTKVFNFLCWFKNHSEHGYMFTFLSCCEYPNRKNSVFCLLLHNLIAKINLIFK